MRSASKRRRGLLALAGAVLFLLPAAQAGAVSGVAIRSGEAITARGSLVITDVVRIMDCNVTLTGSLATSLVAVSGAGAQIGSISGMTTSECAGGSVRAVLNLPWSLKLERLNEDDPKYAPASNITEASVKLERFGVRYLFSEAERECLATVVFPMLRPSLRKTGSTEYLMSSFSPAFTGFIGCFGVPRIYLEVALVTAPTLTFLVGNEIVDGITPTPVEFGRVEVNGVAQRTVTIGLRSGSGRIEEITIASGRYFAITDPNSCRGTTLTSHTACSIRAIVSTPGETERSLSDTLTVRVGERRYEATLRAST